MEGDFNAALNSKLDRIIWIIRSSDKAISAALVQKCCTVRWMEITQSTNCLSSRQLPPCNQTWCPGFWFLQIGRTTEADSPGGRLFGGSLWKEALVVHRTGQRLPAGWLESKVSPSQSGLQGFRSPRPGQSPQHFRHCWREEAESHTQYLRCGGESL